MIKYAIIVTYEPEKEQIKKLTETIEKAGFLPLVADNSEKSPIDNSMVAKSTRIVRLNGNAGIAAAQNAGVDWALKHGAEILSFFDQDSEAEEELLKKLEHALKELGECVVAPVAVDQETNEEYPVQRLGRYGYPRDIYVRSKKNAVQADLIISSGTMTKADVFRKVGNFDEDFFIDFVDVEWCLRCKRAGIPVYVIPQAVLKHKIGKECIQTDHMTLTVHSPVRTYYKVRNAFLLLYKKAGVIFAIRQILPALVHNFLLLFYVKEKKQYLQYYLRGICHGIMGVRGSLEKDR